MELFFLHGKIILQRPGFPDDPVHLLLRLPIDAAHDSGGFSPAGQPGQGLVFLFVRSGLFDPGRLLPEGFDVPPRLGDEVVRLLDRRVGLVYVLPGGPDAVAEAAEFEEVAVDCGV